MRSYAITVIWAGLITGLSVWGNLYVAAYPAPGWRPAILAALPAFPGDLIAAFLGLGHGRDGFPTQEDKVPYVFTFIVWWGLIHVTHTWWARRN